ncbi:hypothetical protein [Kitasatospora sp. NPDC057015]|uniref:hypothetical protein n=1 Tax=Kitasatospora sp. NPDC057015 TaxID=3346001 RepID=UPI003627D323
MTTTDEFLHLSAELTGFGVEELSATGLAETYRALVEGADPHALDRLRSAVARTAGHPPDFPDEAVRELARTLVQLWYLGSLPGPPPGQGAPAPAGLPTVVSARAYAEGLVWRTFGARAPGTAAPGHGSWSLPPDTGPRRPTGRPDLPAAGPREPAGAPAGARTGRR